MARASLLTHASPAAATSLEKRKRPATTIIVDDSESEDVVPTPKKRRDNVSALRKTNILPDLHPRHVHNASSRDRRINVEKSRRLTAALPSAIYPVEPEMHVSNERLASGIRRNNADEKLVHRNGGIHVGGLPGASRGPRLGNAATTINGADATISPTNDNNSETSTTSRTLTMSAMQKQKNMVWNRKCLDFL